MMWMRRDQPYRCFFFHANGNLTHRVRMTCRGDAAAITAAQALAATRGSSAIEIWHEARLVARLPVAALSA